jgi:hypothetical protein
MMIMTFLHLSSPFQNLNSASSVRRLAGKRFHRGRTVLYYCFESKNFTN